MSDQERIGPYILIGELGRGAMAKVWRAFDPNLEREVAIKEPLLDPRLSEAVLAEMGRRFVAEGRAAARLNHPNIVQIHAANVWDGRPAIVMELVEGCTLTDLIAGGPLSPASALSVLDQLLDAVGYAHGRGIVHRDIKPDNVFVTPDGRVKLADFGIAHLEDGGFSHATVAGSVLGTPGYMSPEQARGTSVDARSDLFSVGVVAYEMLTGKNPFGAGECDSMTLLYRIVHEPAPALPANVSEGLPADLRPAIMCALAKDPKDRPSSAGDLRAMLHGEMAVPVVTQAIPVVSAPPTPTPVPQQRAYTPPVAPPDTPSDVPRRNAWLPYAIVAGAAMLVLAIILVNALQTPSGSVSPGTTVALEPVSVSGQTTSVKGSSDSKGTSSKKEPKGSTTQAKTSEKTSSANAPAPASETKEKPKSEVAAKPVPSQTSTSAQTSKKESSKSPASEPVKEPEPVKSPEPVKEPEPVKDPEAILEPEAVPEPADNASNAGSRYELVVQDISWTDAKAACEAKGGHLVTITSEAENDEIKAMMADAGIDFAWIGLYITDDGGTYTSRWVTGEPFSYQDWHPTEPSHYDEELDLVESYGEIWHFLSTGVWSWNDDTNAPFTYPQGSAMVGNMGYVCEYE